MHQAFLAAAVTWGACLAAGLVGVVLGSWLALAVMVTVAGLLTGLWLLHLAVFATRALTRTPGSVAPVAGKTFARRVFVLRFASVFVGAALATGFRLRKASAAEWYECGGTSCGGTACCPTSQPILNHCDCRCYQSSSDFDNCGSYNQCALDGSNCQG